MSDPITFHVTRKIISHFLGIKTQVSSGKIDSTLTQFGPLKGYFHELKAAV